MLCSCFYFIISHSEIDEISKALNVDLSDATVCVEEDTHSGFGNDGYEFYEILISQEQASDFIKEICEADGWNEFPLTKDMENLIYGESCQESDKNAVISAVSEESDEDIFSLVKDDEYNILFPRINEGYYFFCDNREGNRDYHLNEDFFQQFSYNFTVAIYDVKNFKLYYYKLDT